jgi:hypothetical protein
VAFFRDIGESPNAKPGSLQSQIYQSAVIAERVRLPKSHGLLALAFEMFMDNHGTFPKLVSQASTLKSIKTHEKLYEDFCKEYKPLSAEMREIENAVPVSSIFRSLDPRISEIVLQFPALAKLAGKDATAGSSSRDAPHVFLPFLLDCPIRTSSWEMSTSVRQLAYGLINLIIPEDSRRFTVYEHKRQQKNSTGREWQLPSRSEIPDACMSVVRILDQLQERLPNASKVDLWVAAAISQDIEWASSLDKTPLSRVITDQLFDLQDPTTSHKNCSWDIIQFLAQIQGSYYSFRILKQIISLLIPHAEKGVLPEAVLSLHSHLKSLPGFCDVPDLNHVSSLYQEIQSHDMLEVAHEILGIDWPASVDPTEASVKLPRKKRKRKEVSSAIEPSAGEKKSTNPFELLAQE